MRRARIDSTHREIRETLRRCGWLVMDTHGLPRWIDLVCFHPAREAWMLVDAKSPKGKLTDSQKQLVSDGWLIEFVTSAEEAAKL